MATQHTTTHSASKVLSLQRKMLCLVFLLTFCACIAFAQGTYSQIDVPGTGSTTVSGINNAGEISGTYVDDFVIHGFLLKNGVYTTVDYPGGTQTEIYGLNDSGQVVGVTQLSFIFVGFVYDEASQTFTNLRFPDAFYTTPNAINNSGVIVGQYSRRVGPFKGFEFDGTTYHTVLPRGGSSSELNGISDKNEVVGIAVSAGQNLNFSFSPGNLQHLNIPGLPSPAVLGMDSTGQKIVGEYDDSGTSKGFLYQDQTVTSLVYPGAIFTQARGVNASGAVVGYFEDSSGAFHGFTWTP